MYRCQRLTAISIAASFCGLLVVSGCNRKPQETYPVTGVLQWKDGKPATELAGASVELQVVDGVEIRVSPRGEIQPDGRFEIRTYEPKDGAPAGNYLAMVMPVLLADPGAAMTASPLDARYQSFKTTPLKVTVAPQSTNEIVLSVDRAKGR